MSPSLPDEQVTKGPSETTEKRLIKNDNNTNEYLQSRIKKPPFMI
ncbi:hypothetical protein ASZ90_018106 [hydrocarbon metagenome]|uniref:Uncharacterized protein n=1 Tax=hydrocarbon metagenome TaxID=938273 RepID=A0A0W8E7U9_9ZZZZ